VSWIKKKAKMLAHMRQDAKNTYTPHCMFVYMLGRLFVAIKVQIQTDAAANGPETERNDEENISAGIIHGRPLAS
jgi:hypothetical protein